MPTWPDVGVVLAIGVGILLSIEIVKRWLRRRMDATFTAQLSTSTARS